MDVTVMSRDAAIKYCKQPHETKTIMISVSDPYNIYHEAPFCSDENGIVSILPLCFPMQISLEQMCTDGMRSGKICLVMQMPI